MKFFKRLRKALAILQDLLIISAVLPEVEMIARSEFDALKARLDAVAKNNASVREFLGAIDRILERL